MKRLFLILCLCFSFLKVHATPFYETKMTAENAENLMEQAFMAFMDDTSDSLDHLKAFFDKNQVFIAAAFSGEETPSVRFHTCAGFMLYFQSLAQNEAALKLASDAAKKLAQAEGLGETDMAAAMALVAEARGLNEDAAPLLQEGQAKLQQGVGLLKGSLETDPWAGILLARLKWDAFIKVKNAGGADDETQRARLIDAMGFLHKAYHMAGATQVNAADYALTGMIDLVRKHEHLFDYIVIDVDDWGIAFPVEDDAFMERAFGNIYMARTIACAYNKGAMPWHEGQDNVEAGLWIKQYYVLLGDALSEEMLGQSAFDFLFDADSYAFAGIRKMDAL